MIKMSSKHFIASIIKDNLLTGIEVDGFIELDETLKIKKDQIFINHCVFHEEFIISTKCKTSLKFKDVQFKRGLIFDQADIAIANFENCNIQKLVINNCSFENFFQIEEKTEINEIAILNSEFETKLIIKNSKVLNFDRIHNCLNITSLEIINSEIYGRFDINKSNCKVLRITDSIFHNDIWIQDSAFEKYILMQESKFLGRLNFEFCNVKDFYLGKCIINYLSFKLPRKIKRTLTNNFHIRNTSFQNECIIEDEYSSANEISINKLKLGFGPDMKGELIIRKIIANEILLNGNNYYSDVLFDNVNANNILIDKFSNYKSLRFFNLDSINQKSNFKIFKSNLGNTHFNYCNLSNYKCIEIKQSNVSEIIASGVNWFNYKSLIKNSYSKNRINKFIVNIKFAFNNLTSSDKTVIEFIELRELFRQLKFVMEKQGNKILALQFKQYEMQAYKQELKLTKPFYNLERFILWANQSNNHGQNWFKPILLGSIFSIMFLWLIVFSSTSELSFKLSFNYTDIEYTFKTFWENLKYFPNIMNPAFKLKNIFSEQNFTYTFGSYFWALIQRISIAFFIYQTITAFRKYSSK